MSLAAAAVEAPNNELPDNFDDDDGDEEEAEERERRSDRDESESDIPNASDLEEEAQYDGQPACGLSPRLALRRGVETLQANFPPTDGEGNTPKLARVDTIAGFQNVVGEDDPLAAANKSPPPPLGRVDTMSGLPEVRDAFSAVDDDAPASSSSAAAASSKAAPPVAAAPAPSVVRRVDTMELLQDFDEEGGAINASKRQRSSA